MSQPTFSEVSDVEIVVQLSVGLQCCDYGSQEIDFLSTLHRIFISGVEGPYK